MNEKNNLKKVLRHPLFIIFGILVGITLLVSLIMAVYVNHYLKSPASNNSKDVAFEVKSGEGVRSITNKLDEAGLIDHDIIYLLYLKVSGNAGNLKAGNYMLNTNNSPLEITDILTNGKVASVKITIPEGWTNSQIADYLDKKSIVKKSDFLAATKESYNFEFLKGLPAGSSVEGYLFPDTYQIPYKVSAQDIVTRMLENFDKKLTTEMREQIATSTLNLNETITLASIVEREVSKPEDRKTVAGIFLARIKAGIKLQSDVTVNYALGSDKKVLDNNDIALNSPYNTYVVAGLPKGPISNPGLESIQAVIKPNITDFWYFLAADGTTYYSKTFEEHEAKRIKYLTQ